ncbi:MAG: 5-oxoprolinase [Dehalococcoidia bacterium]|nr:MAG: 5-oxoprolinase [Dehalococcoidia bacterium]
MVERESVTVAVDPIVVELVQGTVESARREMEQQIERTARSIIIRERRDYRAAVFDRHGNNVSSASSAAFVDPITQTFAPEDIHEGDVFLWNHPFRSAGGITHLPDLCLTQPVFWQGELEGYVQAFGHVLDIGGLTPGSIAIEATEVFQEGLLIPPVKLYAGGVRNEALVATILANTRFPEELRGDLDAEALALRVGVRRLSELLARVGRETVRAAFEACLERCALALRERVVARIPEGTAAFEDFVELNGAAPAEERRFIRLRVALRREGARLVFDFRGTDRQAQAAINIAGTPKYYAKYLMSIFRPLVGEVILNSGALRVLEVELEEGSVLQARPPAASAYRAVTLFRVPDIAMGALAKALGGWGAAGADTRNPWRYSGSYEGRRFLVHDGVGAGGGGRALGDGPDAVHGGVGSTSVPVEFLEATYPVRVERYGLAQDSGGPGKHRGGHGIHKEVRLLAPGSLWIFGDRMALQPWGIGGGRAGAGARFVINPHTAAEQVVDYKATDLRVEAGDLLSIQTPGGGGWGDPLERDPEAVARDVADGSVSETAAFEQYGVVLVDGAVDVAATSARRAALAAARGPLQMVDRGERFRALAARGEITLTTRDDEPEVTNG